MDGTDGMTVILRRRFQDGVELLLQLLNRITLVGLHLLDVGGIADRLGHGRGS